LDDAKAIVKCRAKLERLKELGYELRRPEADRLRDGIYELRIGLRHINYRLLYFFSGKDAVVVSHGLTKEAKVPASEIDLTITRRTRFLLNPTAHSFRE
jgi:phage-related protein